MAYRALAENRAKLLTQAQNRVIELENEVANCEARLEAATLASENPSQNRSNEVSGIQCELINAKARICKLEAVGPESTRLQKLLTAARGRIEQLDKENAGLTTAHQQAQVARQRISELEIMVKESETRLEAARALATKPAENIGHALAELNSARQQLEGSKAYVAQLETEVAVANTQYDDLKRNTDDRLGTRHAEISRLTRELKAAQASDKMRSKEVEQSKATEVRLRNERNNSEKKVQLLSLEVQKLKDNEKSHSEEQAGSDAELASVKANRDSLLGKVGGLSTRLKKAEIVEASLRKELAKYTRDRVVAVGTGGATNCYVQSPGAKGKGGRLVTPSRDSRDESNVASTARETEAEIQKLQTSLDREKKRR